MLSVEMMIKSVRAQIAFLQRLVIGLTFMANDAKAHIAILQKLLEALETRGEYGYWMEIGEEGGIDGKQ